MYPASWIRITRWCLIRVMMVCSVLQEYCNINENLSISLCFLLPLPSFLWSPWLPPPVPRSLHLHVIHPSSPSAHSIIKSFSSCFAKCHVDLSHAPLPSRSSPLFTFSLPFHSLSLYISKVKTRWNVSLSRWHYYLWSIAIHSSGLYVLASTECQFNTLLYTFGSLLWGHWTKVIATDSIFLHYTDLTSFCVWKRQRISLTLIYASLSVTLGCVL